MTSDTLFLQIFNMEIQFESTTSLYYIFNKHAEVLADTGGTQSQV